MIYHHKQVGFVTVSAAIIAFLFLSDLLVMSLIFWSNQMPAWATPLTIALMALSLIMLVLFSFMTIRVDEKQLVWHFSLGFWRKSVLLDEIEQAKPVKNSWWNGWGIRRVKGGWLYNVSGLRAVEIKTGDGRLVRLGTDEPEELADAINGAISK